jgi:hypothetical protein
LLDDLGFISFYKLKEFFIEVNIYDWHFAATKTL